MGLNLSWMKFISFQINLKKMPIKFFCLGFLIIFYSFTGSAISDDVYFDRAQVSLNGKEYVLEIARSGEQRRHGLMFRYRLDKRQGMLFIYPRSGDHRIWMKNTLIPLTVVWIDETRTVIGIKKLAPCTADPCPSFGVSRPSKYVLELNNENHGLNLHQRLDGIAIFD